MKRSLHRAAVLLAVVATLAGCGGAQEKAKPADLGDTPVVSASPAPSVPTDAASEAVTTPPAATYAPDITSNEVPVDPELTITIDGLRQAGGHVNASARVSSDGTCVFQFDPSDGSRPVVREITAGDGACSVSIPEVEFAFLGSWTLRTTLYHRSGKAEDSADVTIH
jgi:hypothetical protein